MISGWFDVAMVIIVAIGPLYFIIRRRRKDGSDHDNKNNDSGPTHTNGRD